MINWEKFVKLQTLFNSFYNAIIVPANHANWYEQTLHELILNVDQPILATVEKNFNIISDEEKKGFWKIAPSQSFLADNDKVLASTFFIGLV